MKIKKILTNILCLSIITSNIIPTMATYTEQEYSYAENNTNDFKDTQVIYEKAGSYFVTIPKIISLGTDKQSDYSVKVEGDISSDRSVYVSPIDSIKDTEAFDFYMKDQNTKNAKDNVVATVTQNKFYWNFSEAANGYVETNNKVTAEQLTSGTWQGTFDFEINMRNADGTEIHRHNFVDRVCTGCGETVKTILDLVDGGVYEIGTVMSVQETDALMIDDIIQNTPYIFNAKGRYKVTVTENDGTTSTINIIITEKDHVHNYTETIIKEATCTEEGTKELICSCGDTKTEITPVIEHKFENGNCTVCGKEYDPYETAPTEAINNWNYTLDDTNNIITLNYYTGSETDVIVYGNYVLNGKTYKTQIANANANASATGIKNINYMFNGYAQKNCKNIKSIIFSKNVDTSQVTNMYRMFYQCHSLISLDLSMFDTSKVTDMRYMFEECKSLISLDLSNWNTSKAQNNMYQMFANCNNLKTIYVTNGKWYANSYYMFSSCGTSSVTYK